MKVIQINYSSLTDETKLVLHENYQDLDYVSKLDMLTDAIALLTTQYEDLLKS